MNIIDFYQTVKSLLILNASGRQKKRRHCPLF